MSTIPIPPQVLEALKTAPRSSFHRLVIMTCGLCGSGKSTMAQRIVFAYPNFVRLSIDATILLKHGVYLKDYPPSDLPSFQDEAEIALKEQLKKILRAKKKHVVLDMAFYNRETRDEYRELVEREGEGCYDVILVVFKGTEKALWERIQGRKKEFDEAVSKGWKREGIPVERELLSAYMKGFEWPDGEGEIVVKVE